MLSCFFHKSQIIASQYYVHILSLLESINNFDVMLDKEYQKSKKWWYIP